MSDLHSGSSRQSSWLLLVLLSILVSTPAVSWGANWPPEVDPTVRKAVDFLSKSQAIITGHEAGLVAYACLSAGESADGPVVRPLIDVILKKFGGGYKNGHHIYEAGVDAMALVAADREKHRDKLQELATYIMRDQRSFGSWDYLNQDHGGDTSISQYGMLGLWAAARAGVEIPVSVWEQSANWHLRTQLRDGAWCYQPKGELNPLHSMTVAGIGTLSIARIFLANQLEAPEVPRDEADPKPKKNDKAFGVLERVTAKELTDQPAPAATPAKLTVTRRELDAGISRGMGWISRQYTVEKPTGWHLYYLYGLERATSLNNADKVGGHDWYTEGYRVLMKKQGADGSWNDMGGAVSSTCFALLFLTRATDKLVPKAQAPKPTPKAPTFGGGLLAGGRGLPTALSDVDIKDGAITAKKTDTPLDKLLAELENPKSQKVESAQAALVEAVQVGQREQLIGQKDLLLKLAKDSRVDVRRTAFWALGRCNDLRVAPVLIQGLMDADFDAAVEARNALCVLSRRPRGFGLPDDLIAKLPAGASQAEKESAFEKWREEDVRRWREWYQSVRPYSERDKLPD